MNQSELSIKRAQYKMNNVQIGNTFSQYSCHINNHCGQLYIYIIMLACSLVCSVKVPPSLCLSLHSFNPDTYQHSFGGIDTRIEPSKYPFVRIIIQTKIVKKTTFEHKFKFFRKVN